VAERVEKGLLRSLELACVTGERVDNPDAFGDQLRGGLELLIEPILPRRGRLELLVEPILTSVGASWRLAIDSRIASIRSNRSRTSASTRPVYQPVPGDNARHRTLGVALPSVNIYSHLDSFDNLSVRGEIVGNQVDEFVQ
jgi:hypothetical protein